MSPLTRGRLLAICAPVFWSVTGIVVRVMERADQWQINFYRSSSLALFILVLLWARHGRLTMTVIGRTGRKGVLGGLCVGFAMFTNIIALSHTTVANATLVMATGPMIAAVVGWFVLRERVSRITWCAVFLAAVGLLIMVGGNPLEGGMLGDLVALIGMFGFGFYAVILRSGKEIDMTPAVFYAGVFSAVPAGVVAMVFGSGLAVPWTDFVLCTGLGVVQLGIGSVLFAMASTVVPAVELTLFALGEPLLAPIWVWIGVGEVPSISTFIGGAILIGALLLHLFGNRPEEVVIIPKARPLPVQGSKAGPGKAAQTESSSSSQS